MNSRNKVIENKYLITFAQVAKYKSFTTAAEALFMTQPAVSQHIKKVESKLGVSIFDRTDGFELTREGEILLKYTEKGLKIFDDLHDELSNMTVRSHFKIAVSNYFCKQAFESLIEEFHNLENLDVDVIYFHSLDTINAEEFDLVFAVNHIPDNLGRSFKAKSERYVIASSSEITEDFKPNRVVSCGSIDKNTLLNLLDGYNIDLRNVTGWLSSPSPEIILSELKNPLTVVIGPASCLAKYNVSCIETDLKIDMYVWRNKKSIYDIGKFGLNDCIENTLLGLPMKKQSLAMQLAV